MNDHAQHVEHPAKQVKMARRYVRLFKALGGAVLLAVVGNAVWDLLARPGLTTVGRVFLNSVTFGSNAVKDAAYSSAALDPYPVSALLILFFVTSAPFGFVMAQPMIGRWRRLRRRFRMRALRVFRLEQDGDTRAADEQTKLTLDLDAKARRTKRRLVVVSLLLVVLGIAAYTTAMVVSQAILIRRVFLADLAICAPYVTPQQEREFRASFAAVSKRSEFLEVHARLEAVARANGVSLRSEGLW